MMGDYYNYGYHGLFGLGGFLMIIFWVLVFLGIVILIKGLAMHGHHGKHHYFMDTEDKAMSLLKERYAKGEISKEEFAEKKKELMS